MRDPYFLRQDKKKTNRGVSTNIIMNSCIKNNLMAPTEGGDNFSSGDV